MDNSTASFIASCREDTPVEELKERVKNGGTITRFTYATAFSEACISGHLIIAQWLITLFTFNNWQILFTNTVQKNLSNLTTIQWLYTQSQTTTTPINIGAYNCYALYFAIGNNAIDIAEWIYDIITAAGNTINFHTFVDAYFHAVIRRNHVAALTWIFSKIPIDNKRHFSLKIINLIVKLKEYRAIYSIIEIYKIRPSEMLYELALFAVTNKNIELFNWVLQAKFHFNISANNHNIMHFCVTNNLFNFINSILYYYSIYYRKVTNENGIKHISCLNPIIECINKQTKAYYELAIYMMKLRKGDVKKEIDCGICMKMADEPDDNPSPFVVTTACGHSFCFPCFVNWNENPISLHRCAFCRTDINYTETTYYINAKMA